MADVHVDAPAGRTPHACAPTCVQNKYGPTKARNKYIAVCALRSIKAIAFRAKKHMWNEATGCTTFGQRLTSRACM